MIPGLKITPNFISSNYEQELIKNILQEPWNTALARRTQHYGYKYNYTSRSITQNDFLGPFPQWLDQLTDYITTNANLKRKPDQVIINEYLPGQSIAPHIDVPSIFDEHICSLSLGSNIMMIYSHRDGQKHEYYLERCSLLEMTDDARYKWKHSIPSKKVDIVNGFKMPRGTRYSITFRKIILT